MHPQCSIPDCERESWARGFCKSHYDRWRIGKLDMQPRPDARVKEPQACSIEGCGKVARSHGWCPMHVTRWKRHGDPLHVERLNTYPSGTLCSHPGCERSATSRGLCKTHYGRLVTTGDVNKGRGHNGRPLQERFWDHVNMEGPVIKPDLGKCWRWTGKASPQGYGRLRVGDHRSRLVMAHRASWEIHIGPVPDGLLVCHHCDNPPCTNPSHLFLGTDADNCADMWAKGRANHNNPARGEHAGGSKLTEQDVLTIRDLSKLGEPQSKIGARYGVAQSTVSKIVLGYRWSHI